MKLFLSVLLLIPFTMKGQTMYQTGFEEFWNDFNNHYAYFEEQKIDWRQVKKIYKPIFDTISNERSFIQALERLTDELHNGHISLNVNLASSNRIIPSGSDLFVEERAGKYIIVDVKAHSKAEQAGLTSGMQLIKFNHETIEKQLQHFLPLSTNTHSTDMKQYALNMLCAGRHNQERILTILDEHGTEQDFFPDRKIIASSPTSTLDWHLMKKEIAYIQINNSLGNRQLIDDFDAVMDTILEQHISTLILDLTNTPNGGNTLVARGIMGRFIDQELPYQKHQFVEDGIIRSWVEYVVPRKDAYNKELIILVGRWTGSMGEGIAIGLDGMKRAKVVGTLMARLLGAVDNFKISGTNIGFQMPTERLYHIDGTPREQFLPPYLTKNQQETWEQMRLIFQQGN